MPFVSNPTLALGLTGLTDGSAQIPFLDLMKQARPWKAEMPGDDLDYAALVAGGYLDESGWPISLPAGASNIQTMWPFPSGTPGAEGPWVLTYEGEGTLNVNWVDVTASEPGRIEFTNTGGDTFWMSIEATDPNHTGDYIRNIRIVPAKYEALADTGEIFNPDFLAVINPVRQLRFMDWMDTNHSTQSNWEDRPQVGDFSWVSGSGREPTGVPVEIMVALANKIGADPWFNMPHMATDAYIENFAIYVRDNLNPGLRATPEYSNETWNFNFGQYTWLAAQALAEWGVSGGDGWIQYSAKRATETALIWDTVFGAEASTRLYHVIGVHPGWQGLAETQVNAALWEAEEPGSFVAPATVFDAFAITTYFGGEHVSTGGFSFEITTGSTALFTKGSVANPQEHGLILGERIRLATTGAFPDGVVAGTIYYVKTIPSLSTFTLALTAEGAAIGATGAQSGTHTSLFRYRLELIEQIESNLADPDPVYDWLTDRLVTRADIFSSVPETAARWASYRTFADSVGLDMVAYEGGNHEHHSAFTSVTSEDLAKFTTFYMGYSFSPQIADVYEAMWQEWSDVSDGPFMQFTDVAPPSQYGSFAMLRSLTDSNARADMLYELNATYPAWAGMTGGDHYLPQVVDQLEDGETAEFNVRGGLILGGGFNHLIADRPLSEFALSRDESGHLHVGDLELRDFRGAIVFPAET